MFNLACESADLPQMPGKDCSEEASTENGLSLMVAYNCLRVMALSLSGMALIFFVGYPSTLRCLAKKFLTFNSKSRQASDSPGTLLHSYMYYAQYGAAQSMNVVLRSSYEFETYSSTSRL